MKIKRDCGLVIVMLLVLSGVFIFTLPKVQTKVSNCALANLLTEEDRRADAGALLNVKLLGKELWEMTKKISNHKDTTSALALANDEVLDAIKRIAVKSQELKYTTTLGDVRGSLITMLCSVAENQRADHAIFMRVVAVQAAILQTQIADEEMLRSKGVKEGVAHLEVRDGRIDADMERREREMRLMRGRLLNSIHDQKESFLELWTAILSSDLEDDVARKKLIVTLGIAPQKVNELYQTLHKLLQGQPKFEPSK